MIQENVNVNGNAPRFSDLRENIIGITVAAAIGLGWLALASSASYGGWLLVLTFGPAPANVDRPYIAPDNIWGLLLDSALALGSCAAIAATLVFFLKPPAAGQPRAGEDAGNMREAGFSSADRP